MSDSRTPPNVEDRKGNSASQPGGKPNRAGKARDLSRYRKSSHGRIPGRDIELVPLSSIRPSSLNDKLYRPVDPDDPDIIALAASIKELGVLEPLVITADNIICSGHRR